MPSTLRYIYAHLATATIPITWPLYLQPGESSCDRRVIYLSPVHPTWEGAEPAHPRGMPLPAMKHMLEDESLKANAHSYPNYPHFLIAYKVHHHMWRDDQFTNLKLIQHPCANQKFALGT